MKCITGIQLAITILPSVVLATLQCYNVRGAAMDDSFRPCNPDAAVSSCCQLNQTDPEVCLGNGLCLAVTDDYSGTIWGEGCTDSSGNDSKCPQICHGKVRNADYYNVMQCPKQGAWCCREFGDWTSCCNTTSQLVNIYAEDIRPQLSSTSATNSTTNNSNNSSGNASLIGGVVGGVLGAALIAALVAAALLWRQNKRLKHDTKGYNATETSATPTNHYSDTTSGQYHKPPQYPHTYPVEAGDNAARYPSELEGTR